ncbi:unnamed protein product [Adineta steineri]|uniref:Cullin family profile domain-containing protein n=1 Tax=Adineta steineri TaxID=433720 RepID=A0A814E0C0_9BILA|nr:unnamed protein product [Adineta steineri]CAF3549667.1 unnamed protein product [Adineta steineri]
MSQTNTFLNQVWTDVSDAMRRMFELQPMTMDTMMKLYNDIDNYFKSSERDNLILRAAANKSNTANKLKQIDNQAKGKEVDKSNESEEKDNQTNDEEVDKIIPGGELYFYLKNFLKQYLTTIRANGNNFVDEDFFRFYVKTWEKYQFVCQVISKLFTSINNNWIDHQRKSKNHNIYDVYTMSMKVWQDIFSKETKLIAQTYLELIKKERDGEKVETSLIRQVVQCYVSAGFTEDERKDKKHQISISPLLSTYIEYFEKPFIKETEQYYLHESNNYLEKNSINSYIKKASERLDQEEKRVRYYLHPTTLEKLLPKLVKILIIRHLDQIQKEAMKLLKLLRDEKIEGEATKLLRNEKIEDLRIAHGLVTRIKDAEKPIQKKLENYTYETGIYAINSIKATVSKEPKSYVEAIFEVHERFSRIVKDAFCDEPGYRAAFDNACGKFINDNAVTKAPGSSSAKLAELLAKYCDTLLRKGTKADQSDNDKKIDQIMVVFNYIHDKDVFQRHYGKMLAKRLVQQLSASDDSEALEACGFEYSSKLQRMFLDIRISTQLLGKFKTYCGIEKYHVIDNFSVMVLHKNAWQFRSSPAFNLPHQLQPTYSLFTEFYTKKHSGRKLELIHEHSKGELQTLYTKQKYILQVSTYQMAILLLFNDVESMTVESICDITQIKSELCRPILLVLIKSQVLKCSEITVNEELKESDIENDYTIEVDENFKSKKIKINLNQTVKSVEQKDAENDGQAIEEKRKMLIEAAIVRTIKARKQLDNNSLIKEIIPQLTSRFQPEIPMIKKCIELLIKKEYLERDPKDKSLYTYLP